MIEVKRLHLAELTVMGQRWPVHGFVVTHERGALLPGGLRRGVA